MARYRKRRGLEGVSATYQFGVLRVSFLSIRSNYLEMSHQCLCANDGWYLGDHETKIEAVDNLSSVQLCSCREINRGCNATRGSVTMKEQKLGDLWKVDDCH